MPKKPNTIDKEEAKTNAASEAAARRAKGKQGQSKKKQFQYYAVIGSCVGVCFLGVFLAMSPSGVKKGAQSLDTYVNDGYFVSEVTAKAEENFTAAASPFFNKWTRADVKWGLDGVGVSDMVGISGAIKLCESDEGTEGGVIPPKYDARDNWAGCFSEVLDSGNCSSSYAIAAAEALAARFCIGDNAKYNGLKLSAQQILSCDKKSKGCSGGSIDGVWSYIQRRGLYPEECLPYAGQKGGACKTECKEDRKLKVLEHCVLTQEKAIKREIYNRGPVVAPVYLKADYLVYSSGVYTPLENGDPRSYLGSTLYGENGKPIMTAAVILGWGRSQGNPYWLVRHSWGSTWGEDGYARVSIDSVVRDGYVLVGTAATEEAVQAAEQKTLDDAKRKEEAKAERAARDERIKETRRKYEEEQAAKNPQADSTAEKVDDTDDDFESEVDLDADESKSDAPADESKSE